VAIPKTINSTTTPFCTADELFLYHDPDQVADMLVDGDNPRPTVGEMGNETDNKYGAMLLRFRRAASGRVESACLVARMYAPEDLRELYDPADSANANTASREILVKLTADLCFWMLCQRRQPNAGDPRNVPGAVEASELLDALRDGQRIFSFDETAAAGLPSVAPPNPAVLVTPNIIGVAQRLFPTSGLNRNRGD
jgi:hypothetical protein